MCGHRRAARRSGVYAAGHHSAQPSNDSGPIMAVISGLQQLSVASHQRPVPVAARNAEIGQQTQGVIYPSIDDEKKLQPTGESINFEVLPTYEEITTASRPTAAPLETHPVRFVEAIYQPQDTTSSGQNKQTLSLPALTNFNTALSSYRAGTRGGKRQVKRAARDFIDELANQERARKEAIRGALMCGDRKQIRRELKPVKAMLKSAVREAKRERV